MHSVYTVTMGYENVLAQLITPSDQPFVSLLVHCVWTLEAHVVQPIMQNQLLLVDAWAGFRFA